MVTGVPVAVVFLGIDRLLRDIPSWLGVVIGLGLVSVVAGLVYLYFYLQELRRQKTGGEAQPDESSTEKMAYLQKAMSGKRDKILEKREQQMKEIPSGPVEPNDLAPATIRIRNRIENIPSDAELNIGKSSDNHLVIPELGVSRMHAKIRPEKTGYVLYDLVSSRGTTVNGTKITKRMLRNGDQIRIGPETIIFNIKE